MNDTFKVVRLCVHSVHSRKWRHAVVVSALVILCVYNVARVFSPNAIGILNRWRELAHGNQIVFTAGAIFMSVTTAVNMVGLPATAERFAGILVGRLTRTRAAAYRPWPLLPATTESLCTGAALVAGIVLLITACGAIAVFVALKLTFESKATLSDGVLTFTNAWLECLVLAACLTPSFTLGVIATVRGVSRARVGAVNVLTFAVILGSFHALQLVGYAGLSVVLALAIARITSSASNHLIEWLTPRNATFTASTHPSFTKE